MKKQKIIPIFLIIFIALFATGCVKKTETDQAQAPTKEDTVKKSDGDIDSFTGNLMDLLKLGKAVKCTGSISEEDGSMNMVVYASGKKSYSEMVLDMGSEGTLETYSIFDGDWMYTWSDQGMATKMKVSDMEDLAGDTPHADDYDADEAEGAQDFQQQFDYKCVSWIPDNSKFSPPSDVEFMDLTETMKDFTEAMETGDMKDLMGSGCAACDMLPDAAQKAECKANLECE